MNMATLMMNLAECDRLLAVAETQVDNPPAYKCTMAQERELRDLILAELEERGAAL